MPKKASNTRRRCTQLLRGVPDRSCQEKLRSMNGILLRRQKQGCFHSEELTFHGSQRKVSVESLLHPGEEMDTDKEKMGERDASAVKTTHCTFRDLSSVPGTHARQLTASFGSSAR